MVLLRRSQHHRGLSLHVKEQVYVKRKRDKTTWPQIASEVKNLAGDRPYWKEGSESSTSAVSCKNTTANTTATPKAVLKSARLQKLS